MIVCGWALQLDFGNGRTPLFQALLFPQGAVAMTYCEKHCRQTNELRLWYRNFQMFTCEADCQLSMDHTSPNGSLQSGVSQPRVALTSGGIPETALVQIPGYNWHCSPCVD
jgi:hypothetical protein